MNGLLLIFLVLSANPVGYAGRMKGNCEVMHEMKWYPITGATRFYAGDRVRAHSNCHLEIVLEDETVITVLPDTEISIDDFILNNKSRFSKITNYIGKILLFFRNIYMGIKGELNVNTPTAVVGVRGTRFMVNVYSPSETEILVLEGEVEVGNVIEELGRIVVREGERTAVFEGLAPSQPQRFDQDEVWRFIRASLPEEYDEPDRDTVMGIYEGALIMGNWGVYPVFIPPVFQTPQSGAGDVFRGIEEGDVDVIVIFEGR